MNEVGTVVNDNGKISITTKDGSIIVMSEEEYAALIETLALESVPGLKERLEEGVQANLENCEEFNW